MHCFLFYVSLRNGPDGQAHQPHRLHLLYEHRFRHAGGFLLETLEDQARLVAACRFRVGDADGGHVRCARGDRHLRELKLSARVTFPSRGGGVCDTLRTRRGMSFAAQLAQLRAARLAVICTARGLSAFFSNFSLIFFILLLVSVLT